MEENKKIIAASYTRYSSHSQDPISIEIQDEHIKKYADDNNMTIIKKYSDEAKTGTNDNRDSFQQLIIDAESGSFQVVLIYNFSRFARTELDAFLYESILNSKGVKLISVQEQFQDSPQGDLSKGISIVVNAFYSKELKQKITNGNEMKKRQGKGLGHNRVGYIRENDSYTIDPIAGSVIREMFKNYAYNNYSIVNCKEFLEKHGIKSINGKPLKLNGVHNILKNPFYNGRYISKGKEYNVEVPKLVDDDTFQLVQNRLSENSTRRCKTRKKDVDEKYPLTSKLYCSNGDRMIGYAGTSKHKKLYRYYRPAHPKAEGACKPIRKEILEDIVKKNVISLFTETLIEQIASDVESLKVNNPAELELKSVQDSLKDTEKAIKNLIKTIEQGCSIPDVIAQLNERQVEKERLEEQVKRLSLQKATISKEEVVSFLGKFINADTFDDKVFALIIDVLVNQIIVDYDGKKVNLSIVYNVNGSNNKKANLLNTKGSHNYITGGDEGDRTPVQE